MALVGFALRLRRRKHVDPSPHAHQSPELRHSSVTRTPLPADRFAAVPTGARPDRANNLYGSHVPGRLRSSKPPHHETNSVRDFSTSALALKWFVFRRGTRLES